MASSLATDAASKGVSGVANSAHEYIIVGSELEALIREMNLIKKHRPKYNIRLKDDKRYPYIKLHTADPFPKVTVTRPRPGIDRVASAWLLRRFIDQWRLP